MNVNFKIIDNHEQLYQLSCIPSAVEMVLKLEGKIEVDDYSEQKKWNNKSDGSFRDYHDKEIKELHFIKFSQFSNSNPDFLFDLFQKIDEELKEGRYVIISLSNDEGNYHMYVICEKDNEEYKALSKAHKYEKIIKINDVKERVDKMKGTDILIYNKVADK